MQSGIADSQYEFMKKNANMMNSNVKYFWLAMGGKEDIAHKNCQVLLAKFDEMKFNYT